MSSVSGPGRDSFRTDLDPAAAAEPATTPEGDRLLGQLQATWGRGPAWLSFLDGSAGLKPLAQRLAGDGKIDANDVKALVIDAKDFGGITSAEKNALKSVVRDLAAKFTPEALVMTFRRTRLAAANLDPWTTVVPSG